LAKYPALDLRFAPPFSAIDAPGPRAGAFQDLVSAELDSFQPTAMADNELGDWRVFFRTAARRDEARAALLSKFREALVTCTPVDVDDEDWARRSQAALTAVRVGRLIVAPPWDAPQPGARGSGLGTRESAREDLIVVVIDPSMGFGTGHHATTRLCLELLQEVGVSGRSMIDVGTGSGVLAIAAAKLGASRVAGIDNDPDALQNARENVERNGVGHIVELRESDIAALDIAPADIVTANLTATLLQRAAADLQRLATSTLIVSGFGPEELEAVHAALGGSIVEQRQEGEWMAATIRRLDR
jgi:ribosomal protein L11 methyltransferase